MKLTLLAFLCLVISCKNEKSSNANSAGVKLKFSPEFGKVYKYDVISESEMVQEVSEKKIENKTKIELGLSYKFGKDSLPGFLSNIEYNKFKIFIKTPELEKELDASTAETSYEPSEKLFSAFDKASLEANIDSVGNVNTVYGLDKIISKMRDMAGQDESANQMLNGSVTQFVNDKYFKQVFENCLKVFSDKILKVGDTISISSPVVGDFGFNALSYYRVLDITDRQVVFDLKSDFELENQQIKIEGSIVTANIEGEQKGKLVINTTTGMISESKVKWNIKGVIFFMGQEVPISIKTINTVSLIE